MQPKVSRGEGWDLLCEWTKSQSLRRHAMAVEAAMRTSARLVKGGGEAGGDDYLVSGSKTWITNARRSGLTALLCKTDPAAQPAHAGISILLAEPGPGFTVSRDLPKLGYKGVETCELVFEDYRVPAAALLGGREGEGFAQMMRGLEIGRVQVASRALGVAQAALDDSLRYAQQRTAFGQPKAVTGPQTH